MVYDSDYDTDDTDELLAAKCSFQPTVVVCSTPQQKALGRAASANEPAEPCTIVEDEDWLFCINASSSRSASAGTGAQEKPRCAVTGKHISKQEAQARIELSSAPPVQQSDAASSSKPEESTQCRYESVSQKQ